MEEEGYPQQLPQHQSASIASEVCSSTKVLRLGRLQDLLGGFPGGRYGSDSDMRDHATVKLCLLP
jgi:hypothetical protein